MSMRKAINAIALLMVSMFQLVACAHVKSPATTEKVTSQESQKEQSVNDMNHHKKILVAFFSRAGENYSVGNVKVGNTHVLAEMIAEATGADLFEIKSEQTYPADYTECTEVAKKEKDANVRPAITTDVKVEDYDIIFIGYPNWWSDAPMPVYTFIDKHSWQGKTVIPFCTHEGSGLSNVSEIEAACKGATMLKGLGIYGHTAQNSRDTAKKDVGKWLKELGM